MTEPVDWLLIRGDLLRDLVAEAEGAAAKYHQDMKGYRQDEHDRLDLLVELGRTILAGPEVPWAAEIQVLQDQIQMLELDLECARRNENNVNYWYGQDDGVRGACLRWQEALTNPIPKPGSMQEPLETLYRQTEALRRDLEGFHGLAVELASLKADLALVRGQRDGYASMIVHVFHDIAHYWHPRNKVERVACDQILDRLGVSVKASLEASDHNRQPVKGLKP